MLLNICLKNNITTENSYKNAMAPVNVATGSDTVLTILLMSFQMSSTWRLLEDPTPKSRMTLMWAFLSLLTSFLCPLHSLPWSLLLSSYPYISVSIASPESDTSELSGVLGAFVPSSCVSSPPSSIITVVQDCALRVGFMVSELFPLYFILLTCYNIYPVEC